MLYSYANKLISLVRQPASYQLGLLSYRRGDWAEAQRHFSKVVARSPQHAASHFKLGMCHFRQGEWGDAQSHFEEALRRDPARKEWGKQLQQAIRHQQNGTQRQSTQAEAKIKREIQANPAKPQPHIEMAAHHRKKGRRWLEIDELKTAVQLGDKSFAVRFALGEALEAMRRFRAAETAFSEAARINPKSAQAWYRAGYALMRTGHDGKGDLAGAQACYAHAMKLDTELKSKQFGIGVFHQKRGHWDAAAQAYSSELHVRPDDAELLYRLGLSYDRCYDWDRAEHAYMSALAFDPKRTGWHERLAFVRERKGDWWGAYQAYHFAAAKQRDPGELHYRALVCLRNALGDGKAAEFLRTEILRLPVDELPAEPTLESTRDGLVDSDAQAVTGISLAAPLDPMEHYAVDLQQRATHHLRCMAESRALSASAWLALGKWQEQHGEFAQAAESIAQTLRRTDDHSPDQWLRLSNSLARSGQDTQAIEAFLASRKPRLPHGTSLPEYKENPSFRLRADYAEALETLPVDRSVVLYESFHGASISCNPFAIYLALQQRPEYAGLFHVWVVAEGCDIPAEVQSASKVAIVRRGSDAYVRYLATAGTLINNVSFPDWFLRRDEQVYLNTWHGTPIKFLGKDIKDDLLAHKNVARNFLNATHLLSQNAYTTDVLLSRYDVKDTYSGVVLESGYPRVDRTLSISDIERGELRARLGCAAGEKLVLYAPTWRGLHGSATIDETALMADLDAMRRSGHRIVLRAHHMVEKVVRGLPVGDIVVPSDIDSNVLLGAIDALVTDYSSIAFDFFVQRKPVIYYAFDLTNYEQERGLYFPLDELPGHVVYDRATLVNTLSSLDFDVREDYEEAVKRFCPHDDGKAAERVIDQIFTPPSPRIALESAAPRRHILFYVGPFIPNGILSSFLNLMRTLPPSEFALTVVVEPESVSGYEERLEQFRKLPSHVALIGNVGHMLATVEEAWVLGKFRAQNKLASPEMFDVIARCYAREFRRLFGDAKFDAVVHFEGYNMNWIPLFAFAPAASVKRRILFQHNEMHAEWREKYPYMEAVFRLYHRFSAVLSVAEQTKVVNADRIAPCFGVPPELFGLAHNLQDCEHVLRRAQEQPGLPALFEELFNGRHRVFITMGRMSVEKDQEKLINAFARVAAQSPDTRLVIFGDGPLRSNLEAQVEQLGLVGRIHMPGRIENPFPWLKRADCFVLSSNHEGQPMVLLEAMTLGKPIVATRIPGNASVLGDRYGLLVDNSLEGVITGLEEFLAGRVPAGNFDFASYNADAVRMFKAGVLGSSN